MKKKKNKDVTLQLVLIISRHWVFHFYGYIKYLNLTINYCIDTSFFIQIKQLKPIFDKNESYNIAIIIKNIYLFNIAS